MSDDSSVLKMECMSGAGIGKGYELVSDPRRATANLWRDR